MCLGRGPPHGGSVAEMYGLESKSSVRRRLRDMLVPVASGRKAGCLAQSGKGPKPERLPRLRNSAQPIRNRRPRELWEDSRSKDSAMDRSNRVEKHSGERLLSGEEGGLLSNRKARSARPFHENGAIQSCGVDAAVLTSRGVHPCNLFDQRPWRVYCFCRSYGHIDDEQGLRRGSC